MAFTFYYLFIVSTTCASVAILLGLRFILKACNKTFKENTANYAKIIYIIGLTSYYISVIASGMHSVCVYFQLQSWMTAMFLSVSWFANGVTIVNLLFNMYLRLIFVFDDTIFAISKQLKVIFLIFIIISLIIAVLDGTLQVLSEINAFSMENRIILTVVNHYLHMSLYMSYIILALVMVSIFIYKLYRMNKHVTGKVDIPKLVRKYIVLFFWQCISSSMVAGSSIYITMYPVSNVSLLMASIAFWIDTIINMSAIYLQYKFAEHDYYLFCYSCDKSLYICIQKKLVSTADSLSKQDVTV